MGITIDQNLKIRLTPEGGVAYLMVNDTGANSIKGTIVRQSNTVDNGFKLIVIDIPDPIGVVYTDGVPNGGLCWVVVSGKAEVLFVNTPVRQHLARGFVGTDMTYQIGYGYNEPFPSAPFATDKHFYEFGHVLETRGAPGLALVNLHFN